MFLRANSLQLCLALCDPMDCNPPGSCVHGILQAIILERVAISYSRGSSLPRDQTCVSSQFLLWQQILYHCATWEDTLKAASVSSRKRNNIWTHQAHYTSGSWTQGFPGFCLVNRRSSRRHEDFENPLYTSGQQWIMKKSHQTKLLESFCRRNTSEYRH